MAAVKLLILVGQKLMACVRMVIRRGGYDCDWTDVKMRSYSFTDSVRKSQTHETYQHVIQ